MFGDPSVGGVEYPLWMCITSPRDALLVLKLAFHHLSIYPASTSVMFLSITTIKTVNILKQLYSGM